MSIGMVNRMEENAIWEKLHSNRKIAQGEAKCYLISCVSAFFSPIALSSMELLINHHDLPSLSPSGHYLEFKS